MYIKNKVVLWLLVLIISVFFITWCVLFVPTNMDELCAFHRLACLYPNSCLNTFRESCSAYQVDYGYFKYFQSYNYIGITSSFLYYPLWSVWKSTNSFYTLGIIFLVIFSMTLVRTIGLGRKYAIVPFCYFPVAFSFLHDSGPVRLGMLSFPILALITSKMLDEPRAFRKLFFGLVAAVLFILCVEDKPFYLYLFPCLLFFIIGCRTYTSGSFDISKNKLAIVLIIFLISAGLYILLFAGNVGGTSYFNYLRNASINQSSLPAVSAANQIKFQLEHIYYYTFSFPMYGSRIFEIRFDVASIFAFTLVCFLLLLIYVELKYNKKFNIVIWLFILSYMSACIIFCIMGNPRLGHHYVYLHIPVLALLLIAANKNHERFKMVVSFVLFSNIISICVLLMTPIAGHSARERTDVFNYLRQNEVATENVINFSTWGGYYNQSLYGNKNQLVTFVAPLNSKGAFQLNELAKITSRNILNVCADCIEEPDLLSELFDYRTLSESKCNIESMRLLFATAKVVEIQTGLETWKMFQIDPY